MSVELRPGEAKRVEIAFGRVGEGASARAALDLMEGELTERQHHLDLQVFRNLDSGEAPSHPTLLTIFAQKHAAWKLLLSLRARVAASQSAARTLQPLMENPSAG